MESEMSSSDVSAADEATTRNLVESLHGCIVCVDHIAIAVADLEESIDWYTRKLGFRLIERRMTRGERTGMISAVVVAGGAVVVLVQGLEPDSQVSKFVSIFGAGVQHVALSVENLEQAMKQVTAAGGVADTPVIQDEGIRQVFLRRDAGSGVRIELIERKGGDFSDKSVQQLFRAFETNDLY
jgi:methylmalonyl-CoA/ethylmalonyl-CoA epimerase